MQTLSKLLTASVVTLALSAHTPRAQAAGAGLDPAQKVAINVGIEAAKTDPRYAATLDALEIDDADDLEAFLKEEKSGANMRKILFRVVSKEADDNPEAAASLKRLKINDSEDLKKALGGRGASTDSVLQIGLEGARNNPEYADWLDQLGIQDASDLKAFAKRGPKTNNLKESFLDLGNGLALVDETALDFGSYQGLDADEIDAIVAP